MDGCILLIVADRSDNISVDIYSTGVLDRGLTVKIALSDTSFSTAPVWEEATSYSVGSWGSSLGVVFNCTSVCAVSYTSLCWTTRSIPVSFSSLGGKACDF